MSLRLSSTAATGQLGIGMVPTYDRQYMTLHSLLEREMRQRIDSEKMIRNDMTQLQEGMARICNQIQEVATDLKGNLPRLFQETKELRRETQQLTIAFHQATAESARLSESLSEHQRETAERFIRLESRFAEFQQADRQEKNDQWAKLCTKQVVQDLADKVGCLDMESHAKFQERKQQYDDAMKKIGDMDNKVQKSLDEFLRGLSKAEYLTTQAAQQQSEYKRASEKVVEEHREMIDTIVFPRIERCENLLNQEMCERVDCLKKIAHELVHGKEQSDRVKEQVDRMSLELGQALADYQAMTTSQQEAAQTQNLDASVSASRLGSSMPPNLLMSSPRSAMTPRLMGIPGLKGVQTGGNANDSK